MNKVKVGSILLIDFYHWTPPFRSFGIVTKVYDDGYDYTRFEFIWKHPVYGTHGDDIVGHIGDYYKLICF